MWRWLGFPGGLVVKNLPAMQETWVQSLGWEDSLEEGMATHCSILAWRIPWTEEPGGLQFRGSQRVWHDWSNWAHTWKWRRIKYDFIYTNGVVICRAAVLFALRNRSSDKCYCTWFLFKKLYVCIYNSVYCILSIFLTREHFFFDRHYWKWLMVKHNGWESSQRLASGSAPLYPCFSSAAHSAVGSAPICLSRHWGIDVLGRETFQEVIPALEWLPIR